MWKDIPTFSGRYEANENGEIRNSKTKRIRKSRFNRNGYLRLNIPKTDGSGKNATKLVHIMVAEAFIKNPHNYSVVNHIDGDKTNNRVNNLEWCTPSDNAKHAYKNGLSRAYHGIEHINAKLNDQQLLKLKVMHQNGISQEKIAKMLGVSQTTVGRVIRGKRYADCYAII